MNGSSMRIIRKSICDHSKVFNTLADDDFEMGGLTYFNCLTFEIEKTDSQGNPDIDFVREIFWAERILSTDKDMNLNRKEFNELIRGNILVSSFDESIAAFQQILSGIYFNPPSPQESSQRLQVFLERVNQIFSLPPTHIFQFEPELKDSSYFNWWTVSGFCFIYLNDETNKGILIAGGETD